MCMIAERPCHTGVFRQRNRYWCGRRHLAVPVYGFRVRLHCVEAPEDTQEWANSWGSQRVVPRGLSSEPAPQEAERGREGGRCVLLHGAAGRAGRFVVSAAHRVH